MAKFVLLLTFPLTFAACTQTEVVPDPVIVEVVKVERVPVPADLMVRRSPVEIPESVTYGQIIQLHLVDRATIETLNSQLQAIEALNDGSDD